MAKYILTNRAVDDLSEIWTYTYDVWSEKQADKYYNMLLEYCQELAENPSFGKNYNEINDDIFCFKASRHIIFYKKLKEDSIEIVRILHNKMDFKSRIQE
jgi:toxin ParE1/3/4